jgi:hypothetical protein
MEADQGRRRRHRLQIPRLPPSLRDQAAPGNPESQAGQKALNHADIKTTTKYAHIVDDEVVAGLDAMQKSRRKSRKSDRKVS